eukprot:475872_1
MSFNLFGTIIFSTLLPLYIADTLSPTVCTMEQKTPNGCTGQSLIGDKIYSGGYKSTSNTNSSMNCSTLCQSDGAFASHSIGFIQSGSTIECDAASACTNAGFLEAPEEIDCDGSNSCSFTVINKGTQLRCDGDRACQSTHITGIQHIDADGAYALLNATIDSSGVALELRLYGYYSGFGATVLCQANDTCEFACSVDGCYNLYANCIGTCTFSVPYAGPNAVFPLTDLSLFNADNYTLDILYDSQQIVTANDMECNDEMSLTFDRYEDLEIENETIIMTDTTVCCRGRYSCRVTDDDVAIVIESTSDMQYKLICSGAYACKNTMIENYLGNIYCSGAGSCYGEQINTTQALYCLGTMSCRKSKIYNPTLLICAGERSCSYSEIYTSGRAQTHYFYFLGSKSAERTEIVCKENDECILVCGGSMACFETKFYPEMGCKYTIQCDDSRCPLIEYEYKTTHPSLHPSVSPSWSPSQHPTVSSIITSTTNTFVADTFVHQTSETSNSVAVFAMTLIGGIMFMPFLLATIAWRFHRKRRGTDRPGYVSLFRFFGGIADWYTDAFWAWSLYYDGHYLWKSAFIFVFGSHLVSIMICIYWITKWRQNKHSIHIAQYAKKYDKFVIFLSVISGFYGAAGLITSHLFHLHVLSLCLDNTQMSSISTVRILNQSLLENIPVLMIQILYLNSVHSHNTDFITLLAMFFTIISIVVMVLTLVERSINYMAERRSEEDNALSGITLEFILQSEEKHTIEGYHIHTHHLISDAIRTALAIDISQVKMRRIQQVSRGIRIYAELLLLRDEMAQNILNAFAENSDLNGVLLNECMDRLAIHLGCITLDIVQIELNKHETNADEQRMLTNVEMQQDWRMISINNDTHAFVQSDV